MPTENEKADVSTIAHVLYLAVGAVMVIIIAAIIVVSWRARKKNTPPFTKHPTSHLILPQQTSPIAA